MLYLSQLINAPVRDRDGELLGNERLGVLFGKVDAFADGFAEKRLGELNKHGDGSRRSTNRVRVHIAFPSLQARRGRRLGSPSPQASP